MLYKVPDLTKADLTKLGDLDKLRERLAYQLANPARWTGTIRRLAKAEAASASTSIEGFAVSVENAVRIIEGKPTSDMKPEDEDALRCYQQAMDRVLSLSADPDFAWSLQLLLDLHYMTCYFQVTQSPGRLRPGAVWVNRPDGSQYEAPPAESVRPLLRELVASLSKPARGVHPIVEAAIAHLNLVSIHPFKDGNGRLARIVQSLALVRKGELGPEFTSIESYLAAHTPSYYKALEEVQGLRYEPSRSSLPWIRFCLEAHLAQAKNLEQRLVEAYARDTFCQALCRDRSWPDRMAIALDQALLAVPVTNDDYRREADVSMATATMDLRRLVDAGYLAAHGAGRGRGYGATPELEAEWRSRRNGLIAEETGRHRRRGGGRGSD
ncbi:MAG: Fic family protein [Candidatus Dormibacteraceae bacterium]